VLANDQVFGVDHGQRSTAGRKGAADLITIEA
jgi:hypothetical protein